MLELGRKLFSLPLDNIAELEFLHIVTKNMVLGDVYPNHLLTKRAVISDRLLSLQKYALLLYSMNAALLPSLNYAYSLSI